MGRISLPHPEKIVDSTGNAFYIIHQSYVRREPPRLNWAAFFIFICFVGAHLGVRPQRADTQVRPYREFT